MRWSALYLSLLIIVAGCNTANGNDSYQAMVNINGTNYYYVDDNSEFTPSARIGEIKEQTPPGVNPIRHLRSNAEAKGSDVYSTKESTVHFIVKNKKTGETTVYSTQETNLNTDQ